MSTANTFVSEYIERLAHDQRVRAATLGDPGNRHLRVKKQRSTTYGPTRGTIGADGCSVHGSQDIRVLKSGRRICRPCETRYMRERRRALGVQPKKKRGRNGREVCTHKGDCDYRLSGSKRYCRTRRTEWQREYRARRKAKILQDKMASLLSAS